MKTTMTASEVMDRSNMSAELLGRKYGELQAQLFDPLIERAVQIIKDQGYVD